MVFLILLGATTFSLVFRGLGGERFLVEAINQSNLSPIVFLLLVMLLMFIAGFFIDFIEIVFIVVPVVAPIFVAMKMDLIWIGILMAINLQTSFLSPPFGFALFYLKGVAPPEITTSMIYKSIVPFMIIQVAVFKKTGKRVFKMAPIHHHFEALGWKENKIFVVFASVTLVAVVAAYLVL